VFRPVNKGDRLAGESMTAQAIFDAVKKHTATAKLERVAPHDLRRSFARLARKGKADLEQIQLSLGHASVTTTASYIGVQQDLHDAPCDHLGVQLRFSTPGATAPQYKLVFTSSSSVSQAPG
jgi:integrase